MFRIPTHKAARLIAAVCVLSVLCLSFFASCTDRPADNAGTLTISVSDATPKMLMYTPSDGGPSAMSHYGVTLKNAEGETLKSTETPMLLYGSSGSFTITGLVSGTYTVDATGYIKTGETYTAIATGTTGSFQLNPSSATTKTIAIDTWAAGNASSVTVDIVMPTDVITGNTATGTLTYALNRVEDNSSVITEKSIQLSSQALTDGKYTLTIPETIAPGRYVLIAGFTASGDDYKYMGAQAMLVYPNLPVTGTLSLDSNLAFESGFTVEDGIGGAIEVSGDGTYASDTDTVSIVLSKALDTGCSIVWYVDGVELAEGDYSVSGTTYTFTGLATGKRNIVGIMWDEGKKASIGALCINVEVRKTPVIEETVETVLPTNWMAAENIPEGAGQISAVCYGDGKFVYGVFNQSKGGYSEDGINWTLISDIKIPHVNAICYGDGKFIAVGNGASYSEDGINWTAISDMKFDTSAINGITFANGKFVAVGSDGKGSYSEDGITWTAISDMKFKGKTIMSVCYADGKFIAVGNTYSVGGGSYSTDGINWTAIEDMAFDKNSLVRKICYGDGKFVAVGNAFGDSNAEASYSEDGITWTHTSDTQTDTNIQSICYANGKFVAVGDGGLYTEDGINWTIIEDMKIDNTYTIIMHDVCYGDDKFVAVGDTGTIVYCIA